MKHLVVALLLLLTHTGSGQTGAVCLYEQKEVELITGDTLLRTNAVVSSGNTIHFCRVNSGVQVAWSALWLEAKELEVTDIHRLLIVLDDTTRIRLVPIAPKVAEIKVGTHTLPSVTQIEVYYHADLFTIDNLAATPVKAMRIETSAGNIDITPSREHRFALQEAAMCFMIGRLQQSIGQ